VALEILPMGAINKMPPLTSRAKKEKVTPNTAKALPEILVFTRAVDSALAIIASIHDAKILGQKQKVRLDPS
jgi:hypothetical protein